MLTPGTQFLFYAHHEKDIILDSFDVALFVPMEELQVSGKQMKIVYITTVSFIHHNAPS